MSIVFNSGPKLEEKVVVYVRMFYQNDGHGDLASFSIPLSEFDEAKLTELNYDIGPDAIVGVAKHYECGCMESLINAVKEFHGK